MIQMSAALGESTVAEYYKNEYTNSESRSYYSQGGTLSGEWHGGLAEELGLAGAVQWEEYNRLVKGQHPHTAEQLIKVRDSVLRDGQEIAHRSAYDITISAHKSVSDAALVGGDLRIVEAHQRAARAAASAIEEYTQVKLGNTRGAETTGKWIAAVFTHDTARPVGENIPRQQLHSHLVVFNMSRDQDGQMRALEAREFYRVQSYGAAVYHSELAAELRALGYRVRTGTNHSAEIVGYTKEYLESISDRRREIQRELARRGLRGAEAAETIAHQVRSGKQVWDAEELRQEHREHAANFGSPGERIVAEAQARQVQQIAPERIEEKSSEALTYARNRLAEQQSVFDDYELKRDALRHSLGVIRLADLQSHIDHRLTAGTLVATHHYREHAPGARYCTPESQAREREILATLQTTGGKQRPIADNMTPENTARAYPHLNQGQQVALSEMLRSRDYIHGLEGWAGTGKSELLKALSAVSQAEGYTVRGLAPTGKATENLMDVGASVETLQMHLTRTEGARKEDVLPDGTRLITPQKPTVYLVDESSLMSTKQLHSFLGSLDPGKDRVFLIGSTKQHQSVEAGRVFEELQMAGMVTSVLHDIVRQKEERLKAVCEQLRDGLTREAIETLGKHGFVSEIEHRGRRHEHIAQEYLRAPGRTLVVSPDNESRQELNLLIREELKAAGKLSAQEYTAVIYRPVQDVRTEDRKIADSYQPGLILKFSRENKHLGWEKGSYAEVLDAARDPEKGTNVVTIKHADGRIQSYDPARAYGVAFYSADTKKFAVGERVMATAPWKQEHVRNSQLATLVALDEKGNAELKLADSGRKVFTNLNRNRHLDYAYAITSYKSQSTTIDITLANVPVTDSRCRQLVDQTLANVAFTRPRYDLQVFTDDGKQLGAALSLRRDKAKALANEEIEAYRGRKEKIA
jgi:conjugative relaxase-like TrwC/TraI family protein